MINYLAIHTETQDSMLVISTGEKTWVSDLKDKSFIEVLKMEHVPFSSNYFKHYKGGTYAFIAIARNINTLENNVVYSDKNGKVWVRPEENVF